MELRSNLKRIVLLALLIPLPASGSWVGFRRGGPQDAEGTLRGRPAAVRLAIDRSPAQGGHIGCLAASYGPPLRKRSRPSENKGVRHLSLVEVPALLPAGAQRDEMAVLLTGDGGWATTDRGLSRELAKGGIPVVGWNSLRDFRLKRKSPDRAARDLEQILRYYLNRWHKEKVVLIGYSFGADVMPFLAARLPRDLADRISLLALLGPSGRADFRFHPSELLGRDSRDSLPTLPELERLRGLPMLCVQGAQEKNSYCPKLPEGLATILIRPGGHIIDKNYGPIATWILGPRKASN